MGKVVDWGLYARGGKVRGVLEKENDGMEMEDGGMETEDDGDEEGDNDGDMAGNGPGGEEGGGGEISEMKVVRYCTMTMETWKQLRVERKRPRREMMRMRRWRSCE